MALKHSIRSVEVEEESLQSHHGRFVAISIIAQEIISR
jgi:hypothetical protein